VHFELGIPFYKVIFDNTKRSHMQYSNLSLDEVNVTWLIDQT